jgi:hypothetical protein
MMEGWTGIDIDGDGKADSANELPHYDPGAPHAKQMPRYDKVGADTAAVHLQRRMKCSSS